MVVTSLQYQSDIMRTISHRTKYFILSDCNHQHDQELNIKTKLDFPETFFFKKTTCCQILMPIFVLNKKYIFTTLFYVISDLTVLKK